MENQSGGTIKPNPSFRKTVKRVGGLPTKKGNSKRTEWGQNEFSKFTREGGMARLPPKAKRTSRPDESPETRDGAGPHRFPRPQLNEMTLLNWAKMGRACTKLTGDSIKERHRKRINSVGSEKPKAKRMISRVIFRTKGLKGGSGRGSGSAEVRKVLGALEAQ